MYIHKMKEREGEREREREREREKERERERERDRKRKREGESETAREMHRRASFQGGPPGETCRDLDSFLGGGQMSKLSRACVNYGCFKNGCFKIGGQKQAI